MKRIVVSLILVGLLSMSVVSVAAADTTEIVSGDTSAGENQPGWLFNRDTSTSTPFEFTMDQASIGQGSLYVLPIGSNPSDKFIGEYFLNVPVANIESITYDFLIGSGGTSSDANEFYMNVYANFGESDDLKFYDCRYNIVPSVSQAGIFTTVTFDPDQAYPVTTRGGAEASPYTCPATPAGMDSLSPGSTVRVFALNVGDTSANDIGLDGYLDNVVVSLAGGTTTYDFEVPPTTDELIADLRATTEDLVTNAQAERTLLASLDRMQMYEDRGNTFMAYLSMLQYVILVERYEDGGRISQGAAYELLALAMQVRDSML